MHTDAVFYRQRENGIRFQVNFTKNTGDLTDLSCLVADRFSNTEQRILAAGQTCSVTAGVDFTAGTTVAVSSGVLTSNFDLSVDSKDTGAITNDWDNNAVDASTQTQLHAGDRVSTADGTVTLTSNFYFNKGTDTLTLSAATSVSAGELVSQGDARGVVKAASTGTSVSVLVVSGTFTDDDGTDYTTFRLYIEVSDAALTNVYALYGTADHPLIVPPAYQVASPFGADFGGVNPALFAANPTAEYDSWLTIGLDDGDPRSLLAKSPGFIFDPADEHGWDVSKGMRKQDAAIFYMDPNMGPAATSREPVVVAQLTTPAGASHTITMELQGKPTENANGQEAWDVGVGWTW